MQLLCRPIFLTAVFFLVAAVAFTAGARATEMSLGVREHFSVSGKGDYSSDAGAKLKMSLTDLGAGSITLDLRVGVPQGQVDALYLPRYRTKKEDLEVMISRIFHGNAVPVLRPVLFLAPELGAPSAIESLSSPYGEAVFSSYEQSMSAYLSTLSLRSIQEFVVGAGMGNWFTSTYGPRWKALYELLMSRRMSKTRLSLEVSDESALRNLEEYRNRDPSGFDSAWKEVDLVRFALPLKEWMNPSTLEIRGEALKKVLLDRTGRLKAIFPGKPLLWSSVFLPACSDFEASGSEPSCAPGGASKPASQAALMKRFFEVWDQLPPEVRDPIRSIHLMAGSTQDEPLPVESDPRFFWVNGVARGILKDRLYAENHHSSEFSSPSRSSFRPFQAGDQKKHACVYFDEAGPRDPIGAIHARMIDNLVGAFPSWAKERRTVSTYRRGELSDCDAVFYLASNYLLDPPGEFISDLDEFLKTKPVAWFNYKFDRFFEAHEKRRGEGKSESFSFHVPGLLQPDQPPTPEVPDPGFFRYFEYKNEEFEKQARFDAVTHLFAASPELARVELLDPSRVKVLSWARHSRSGAKTPYIVRQDFNSGGSLFYFGDLPFSYNHYEDRSLVFCDLIYDILREPAPVRPPIALVRLEDINPSIPTAHLAQTVDFLADRKVPFSMALIPYYSSLFENPEGSTTDPVWKPADQFPEFSGAIRYAKMRGADFVMHGTAHQAGDLVSGFSGSTGSDYEFWSWPADRPHPQDSADWVLSRIELAESVFDRFGIKPIAWEVPHYAASALDFILFGRIFEWNYHRGLYFKSEILEPTQLSPDEWFFYCRTHECRESRGKKARTLQVEADYANFGSEIFPYPIYEDSYGQAVIPESIGMVDFPFYRPDTWRPVSTTEDLLRRAKKLRAIRGSMASFFWHPMLLDPKSVYYQELPGTFDTIGGIHTLETLVKGLRALGYEFASISDCRYFPRKDCPVP